MMAWTVAQLVKKAGSGIGILIHDVFTDANNTPLSAHTIAPTNTVGATWDDYGGQFIVFSNQAKGAAPFTTNKIASVDVGVSDNYKVSGRTPGYVGCCIRLQDSGNYFQVWHNGSTCYLYQYNGSFVARASGAVTAGDRLISIETSGNALTAKHYDASDVVDLTLTYSSASYLAATRAGVGGFTGNYLDDFKVETI